MAGDPKVVRSSETSADTITVDEVVAQFRRENELRQQQREIVIVMICLLLAMSILTYVVRGPLWLFILIAGPIIAYGSASLKISRVQKDAIAHLYESKDMRAVPLLLEAYSWSDPYVEWPAAEALKRLLPLVKASDAGLFDSHQREALYNLLNDGSTALVLAALRAVEQIGDRAAIPFVKRLAELKSIWPAEQRVKTAARECLLTLTTRMDRSGETLLRPVSSDQTDETLLRPAGNLAEANVEKLLRPSELSES